MLFTDLWQIVWCFVSLHGACLAHYLLFVWFIQTFITLTAIDIHLLSSVYGDLVYRKDESVLDKISRAQSLTAKDRAFAFESPMVGDFPPQIPPRPDPTM